MKGIRLRYRLKPRIPCVSLFFSSILLFYVPELTSAAVVTLDSIEIFRTHEWLPSKPSVYFQCKEENRTFLPDVKEKHISYNFKGEESWQPLTELREKKCKRCGFYEKDPIKSDSAFDEWELCASDFNAPDGIYIHVKEKEFNATFLCPECVPLVNATEQVSPSKKDSNGMHWILIVIISASVSILFMAGLVSVFKYWKRRKRQREQARFLQLFDEGDDIDDELGIGPLSSEI